MEDTYLIHHGIKGQRWGVRRFQNEDGTLTVKGRQRLNTVKDKTLKKIDNRKNAEERRAAVDKAELNDLKKNGINSTTARANWEMLTEEERYELAVRGGYNNSFNQLTDILFPVMKLAGQNETAMRQMVKEDIAELEKSHRAHIDRAKAYTKRYEALSMSDVDDLAAKYGYKEAKKQLSSKR